MNARAGSWLVVVILAGCADEFVEMSPRQVCDDVGFAISSRTMACTGDAELAAGRARAIRSDYTCLVRSLDEPIERYYHCPVAVYDLSCAEVRAAGDDLDMWLAASWVCPAILAPEEAP